MPDVLYGGLQVDPDAVTCTGMGTQPGPVGGDGWQRLGSLPTSKLIAGRHYAFIVSGTIRNIQRSGATPNRGLCQIVLGDDSGVKSPDHCFEIGVNWPTSPAEGGQPFQFLVVFAPDYSVTPAAWGSSWANTDPLAIYGRTFWNGDPTAYAVSFEVVGLSWLWIDIDAISSTSRYFAEEHAPSTPITQTFSGSLQTRFLGAAAPGSAGEKWIHFANIAFTPIANATGGGPVVFNNEQTITGALPGFGEFSVGCIERGAPYNPSFRNPTMHFGGFYVRPRLSAPSHRFGYRGDGDALIYRWRHFAFRVDDLPLMSSLHLTAQASSPGPTNDPVVMFHEPPPATIPVAQPIYLAACRADVNTPGFFAHRMKLVTHHGRVLWDGSPVSKLTGERIPMFGASVTALGPGDGPRYANQLIQHLPASPGIQYYAEDVEFLQAWLLRDPSVQPPEPPEPGDFVYLYPTREGAAIGSQATLPIDPEWRSESPTFPKEVIRGSTGIRRTWPIFTAPRRKWTLLWTALTDDQAASLETFLRTNKTFRSRPPQESADVVLLALEQPRLSMVTAPGPNWSCSISVAELVFVGGA